MSTKMIVFFVFSFLMLLNFDPVTARELGKIEGIVNPYLMLVDEDSGRLVIVEGVSVSIYDLESRKLIKKFGKRGEGPGEFYVPPRTNMGNVSVQLLPDSSLAVTSVGKLSYFSGDGRFIREIRSSVPWPSFRPLANGYVGRGTVVDEGINYNTVRLYRSGMEPGPELSRTKSWFTRGREVNPYFMSGPLFYLIGERIYIERDKNFVAVFDHSGTLQKTIDINHSYRKVKVPSGERERWLDYYKRDPVFNDLVQDIRNDLILPDYYPGIRLFCAGGAELVIIRWTGNETGTDVALFDADGGFLYNTVVPFRFKDIMVPEAFAVSKRKIYQLIEDDATEGEWVLHIQDIR